MKATEEIRKIYSERFQKTSHYRNEVWKVLIKEIFQKEIPKEGRVLDLGCGYGEFINNINCRKKWAIDLNPDSKKRLDKNVILLEQESTKEWKDVKDLDVIFTSNFFEHLKNKEELSKTIEQCFNKLRKGGKLICVGPNIKIVGNEYWDFYDHHIALTEESVTEPLTIDGFNVTTKIGKFLPYKIKQRKAPLTLVKLYCKMKWTWAIFGKQFLVIGEKE